MSSFCLKSKFPFEQICFHFPEYLMVFAIALSGSELCCSTNIKWSFFSNSRFTWLGPSPESTCTLLIAFNSCDSVMFQLAACPLSLYTVYKCSVDRGLWCPVPACKLVKFEVWCRQTWLFTVYPAVNWCKHVDIYKAWSSPTNHRPALWSVGAEASWAPVCSTLPHQSIVTASGSAALLKTSEAELLQACEGYLISSYYTTRP